jgi:hypothetical protein
MTDGDCMVQYRYLEFEEDEEGFRDWKMPPPLYNGVEDAIHILLKCPETIKAERTPEQEMADNEEIATNSVELRNLGRYLYKIKCKWENRIKEFQLDGT